MSLLRASHILTVFLLTTILLVAPISATNRKEIRVKHPNSIQEAIKLAQRGTKIIVEGGTYNEQLIIDKDDITLIGQGVTLVPPQPYQTNACTRLAGNEVNATTNEQTDVPTHVGICIIGRNVVLKEFVPAELHKKVDTVGQYVKNVEVSGFAVNGFNGVNIAVVAGKNIQVTKNTLIDGGRYGFLSVGSFDTKTQHNKVYAPTFPKFIGICNDDKSGAKTWHNEVTNYFIGLCVETNGAEIKANQVSEACYGIFVDPGVLGAKVKYNYVKKTAEYCGTLPFPATNGIILSGASNTEVRWNYVEGITAYGADGKTGVGIGVFDNSEPPPAVVANNNIVKENYLKGNDLDVLIISTGTGNVAKRNYCQSPIKSPVAGACI